ncbi:hypothetical protein [Dactylosporangium sp. NPDC000521]|uniref:hypothetical protein n=1 Tax=Dactylosporangium sp. NPDC000521 TaxID=3363975 RepID=UPI00369603BF
MVETYKRWRVPQLWEMVAADDEADAHLHLATLRRQQTALETQRDRLRILRDQLAEGWPPEKSEAATTFIQRINNMIEAMSLVASGAAEVRVNLNLIVEAIGKARGELEPLVEEYRLTAKVPDQRIGQQARGLLDEHARRILMNTDAAVAEPAAGLDVVLPEYQRIRLATQIVDVPIASGQPKSGGRAGGGGGRLISAGFPPPRFDPPGPTVGSETVGSETVGSERDDAVGLAGGSVGQPAPGGVVVDAAGPVSRAERAAVLGPGRVLGANPFTGLAAPSGSGGGSVTSGAAGGSTGARGPVAPPIGRAGSYRDPETVSRRRGEQGESWSVPDGVSPVIQPPATWPHEPGPGVIGIDR